MFYTGNSGYILTGKTDVKILISSEAAIFSPTHPDAHRIQRTEAPGLEQSVILHNSRVHKL